MLPIPNVIKEPSLSLKLLLEVPYSHLEKKAIYCFRNENKLLMTEPVSPVSLGYILSFTGMSIQFLDVSSFKSILLARDMKSFVFQPSVSYNGKYLSEK